MAIKEIFTVEEANNGCRFAPHTLGGQSGTSAPTGVAFNWKNSKSHWDEE